MPCSLAQLILQFLFLPLDRAQSVFRVLYAPLRVLPLEIRIIDERTKSILNFEELTLHFRPETAARQRDDRTRRFGRPDVVKARSERSAASYIAPALARAIIELVLCPLSIGTKITFPP